MSGGTEREAQTGDSGISKPIYSFEPMQGGKSCAKDGALICREDVDKSNSFTESAEEDEGVYGLFKNEAASSVWAEYSTAMRVMDGDDIEGEGGMKVMQCNIFCTAKLDAWIMKVMNWMDKEEERG